MMNSPDDDYGNKDLEEFIYRELVDSSDLNDEDTEMMTMCIQEEMEKQEEHVLNFKGSINDGRVVPRDRIAGARLLYKDYFTVDLTYHDVFLTSLPHERKVVLALSECPRGD